MQPSAPFLRFAIAGLLTRDYLVLPDGRVAVDVPGGNLLFTAAGLAVWDKDIGLIARINEDYPQEWLENFKTYEFDVRGIQVDTEFQDQRNFIAYEKIDHPEFDNPLAHFARVGKPFPKSLLGYQAASNHSINAKLMDNTVRIKDIPFDYLDVTAAHICAMDFSTQTRLPSLFRQGHVTTVNLMANDEYMDPIYWDKIPMILKGINSFICTENQIRNLFTGRTSDIWEMAAGLAVYESDYIVIATNNKRYYLYDHLSKRKIEIPAYPSQIVDPTGILSSFCGGYLAGMRMVHDPAQAVMMGCVSASFTQEGVGPFYCMEALPALVNARMDSLKPMMIQY